MTITKDQKIGLTVVVALIAIYLLFFRKTSSYHRISEKNAYYSNDFLGNGRNPFGA